MNTLAKTVLSSALLTVIFASTSANAYEGKAELPDLTTNNVIVKSDQKIYQTNTIGGDAAEVIAYTDNAVSIKKVSLQVSEVPEVTNR